MSFGVSPKDKVSQKLRKFKRRFWTKLRDEGSTLNHSNHQTQEKVKPQISEHSCH